MNAWQMKYEAPGQWSRSFTPKPLNKDDIPRVQRSIHPNGRARSQQERNERLGIARARQRGKAGEFNI